MKNQIITLLLALPFLLSAQEGLDMKSVSIFKNQTAFFVKSGTVSTPSNSWSVYGDTIPKALDGTFWLGSPTNDFKMVKAYQKTIKTDEQAVVGDFAAMLALNDGKDATLYFEDTMFAGKILFMQVKPKKAPDFPNLNAPLFALKTKEGKTLIFTQAMVNSMTRLEFANDPNFVYNYTASKQLPTLQIDFKSTKDKQPLDMMYLSNGLAWKPDYKIELLAEDKARLSLRSTVVNEAEDIKTDKLNLVAGVPNFKYATKIADLIDFLQVDAYGVIGHRQNYISNIAVQTNEFLNSSIGYASDEEFNAPTETTTSTNLEEATAMEDLYYYTLKDIVLKKGERALFDIFSIEVPIEHIYETVLGDNDINYSLEYSFVKKENPVVHTIKLTNNSEFTWTAAPALVLKHDQQQNAPISQDKLGYTSQKDNISVKLTEAPDVSIKFLEKESGREVSKKTIKRDRYTYYSDLVSVEAEITVHNYKNKPVRLDIKRAITGELKESSLKWKLAPRVLFGYTLNKKTDVCWEMTLNAGEEKVIKYTYSFYTTEHQ